MKTLNEYPAPETDAMCGFPYQYDRLTELVPADFARNLEQRLAICREALEWIAGLYDDSKPIYKVAMDAYSMKSEAATALEATKPKP